MIRILELFSGMGTQSLALEKAIGKRNTEVVGTCDFFLPAITCFNALHGSLISKKEARNISIDEKIKYLEEKNLSLNSKTALKKGYWINKKPDFINWYYLNVRTSEKKYNNLFDITNLDFRKLPECDLLTYSFPCQDISVQGKGKGFDSKKATRSGLLWHIQSMLEHYRANNALPKTLLMENVYSIYNKNHIGNFEKWKKVLKKFGYNSFQYKLNSVDFGSIQSRSRAFLISSLETLEKETLDQKIEDLKLRNNKRSIREVIEKYESNHEWYKKTNFSHLMDKHSITKFNVTPSGLKKARLVNYSNFNSEATIYSVDGKSPTLTATGANSRLKCLTKEMDLISICPKGAFQLMGHSKTTFNKMYSKIKDNISYSQLMHVAGNAISIEVLIAIFKALYEY